MSRLVSREHILVVCGKIIIEIKNPLRAWKENRPFCYRGVSKSKGRFACKLFRNIDDIVSKYASGVPPSRMRNHKNMLKGRPRPFPISVMRPHRILLNPEYLCWNIIMCLTYASIPGRCRTTSNGLCRISLDTLLRDIAKTLYRWHNSIVLWCVLQ